MILHLSRGFVLGVLSTVFVVGGATGYFVRGGAQSGDAPVLAVTRDVIDEPALPRTPFRPTPVPSRSSAAAIKAVPTPGAYYRLAEKETLSDVAKRAYGSTKRTSELVAANPTLDPKRLPTGALIFVPAGIEPIPSPVDPAMFGVKPAVVQPTPVFAKPR